MDGKNWDGQSYLMARRFIRGAMQVACLYGFALAGLARYPLTSTENPP